MLDIKWIRENAEMLDAALAKRGAEPLSASLIALDERRRTILQSLQDMQSRRNAASKEIGAAMGRGERDKAEALKTEVASLKDTMQESEEAVRRLEADLDASLSVLPNLPADDVPVGADEHDEDREEPGHGWHRAMPLPQSGRSAPSCFSPAPGADECRSRCASTMIFTASSMSSVTVNLLRSSSKILPSASTVCRIQSTSPDQ